MELLQKYSAGLAIIYNGKILLGHTSGRSRNTGYGISKGGIEDGESNMDAAVRETYEEFGIKVNRKLIDSTEHSFTVTSRKYKYKKIVYYYIVKIESLSQIGLKSEIISKGKLQIKEIDDARFFSHKEAKELTMKSQLSVIDSLINMGLLESETIGGDAVKPNQEINKVQSSIGEDPRLIKIRQFKGTVKNYKEYWNDRISRGNS
jgi:8-oxo-dGTP pyrophosphatase MutT (NUDIX family)